MNEILEIHVAMEKVIVDLKRLNYADYTIGRYRHCFDGMLRFIEGSGISFYSDELAAEYIKFKFGVFFVGLFKGYPSHVRSSIRALRTLSRYSVLGAPLIKTGMGQEPFKCPSAF
jgi:hypothetical protein